MSVYGRAVQRNGATRSRGFRKEVAAFAENIYTKEPNPKGSPEQAYYDLKLLQGILESGKEGGAAKKI